jgi:hypothetical protein
MVFQMSLIFGLIWMFIGIIVHELGHYVAFRLFGHKPDVKFTWYGILVGQNVWYDVTIFQSYIISLAGVLSGWYFFSYSQYMTTLYVGMCCIDFTNILSAIDTKKSRMKWTLWKNAEYEYKKLAKSRGLK